MLKFNDYMKPKLRLICHHCTYQDVLHFFSYFGFPLGVYMWVGWGMGGRGSVTKVK